MNYRIILKVGYYERHFDFADATEAVNFSKTILEHHVTSEDHKDELTEVKMKIMKEEPCEKE